MIIKSANFKIIKKCNENCKFCYEDRSDEYMMNARDFEIVLKKLSKAGFRVITLSGGEPLLHPEISSFITLTKQFGMKSMLSTNGKLITRELLSDLNESGLDELYLSLGDMSEEHKLDGLERILGIYKRGKYGFDISVNLITTEKFVNSMHEHLEKLNELEIKKLFLIPPKKDKNEIWYESNKLSEDGLIKIIQQISKWKNKVAFITDCSMQKLRRVLNGHTDMEVLNGYPCKAGYTSLLIDNRGNVYPCSRFTKNSYWLGNVLKEEIHTIYSADALNKFFSDWNNGNQLMPPCLMDD